VLLQVRSREEELMNLGSLHTATKAAADKRIAELDGRVSRLLEANRCGLELRSMHAICSAVVRVS
jgi:coiled-coil domain-containing protein 77